MPGSTFHLYEGFHPRTVHIERTGGNLDHYYHFIMDLAWPLFHWAESRGGGWDGLRCLSTNEDRALFFVGHMGQMLGKRMELTGPLARLLARSPFATQVNLIGFNSRVRDYLRTFDGLDPFRASRSAFVARVARQVGSTTSAGGAITIMLIERAPSDDDRGAMRRSIGNHGDLAQAIAAYCARSGFGFRNVRLEELSFAEQFRALHQGRAVLIGQHGAGLLNGLWLSAHGSAVIELAGEDNPAHFMNLFSDLGTPYARVVCAAEGVYGRQQALLPVPERVLAELEGLTK